MKKKICLLLAGVLMAGCVAGCNGKSKQAGDKTELLIGIPGGDSLIDMQILESFKAENADKYTITADEAAWGDFVQKIKLQMAAKNDVTPVFVTDSANAMAFATHEVLLDVSERVEADLDETKYIKALRALTGRDGELWGVPQGVNSIALIYNKDIFDEKGISYPTDAWTFRDMLDAAEKLTFDRNGDGENDVFGIHYKNNITQGWFPFMQAFGVKPLTEDYRNSNLEDPKVKEALDAWAAPILKGHQMSEAELAALGGISAAFAEGKVAMYIAQLSEVNAINKFNPELNYDAAIMPIGYNGERTCIYVPNAWCIYKNADADVQDAAWAWVVHYLQEESQMIQAESGVGGLPIMQTALEVYNQNGNKPVGKDAFYRGINDHGTTLMENPCSTDVNNVLNNLCAEVRFGETTVEEGLRAAHTELQEVLDYYYSQLD